MPSRTTGSRARFSPTRCRWSAVHAPPTRRCGATSSTRCSPRGVPERDLPATPAWPPTTRSGCSRATVAMSPVRSPSSTRPRRGSLGCRASSRSPIRRCATSSRKSAARRSATAPSDGCPRSRASRTRSSSCAWAEAGGSPSTASRRPTSSSPWSGGTRASSSMRSMRRGSLAISAWQSTARPWRTSRGSRPSSSSATTVHRMRRMVVCTRRTSTRSWGWPAMASTRVTGIPVWERSLEFFASASGLPRSSSSCASPPCRSRSATSTCTRRTSR